MLHYLSMKPVPWIALNWCDRFQSSIGFSFSLQFFIEVALTRLPYCIGSFDCLSCIIIFYIMRLPYCIGSFDCLSCIIIIYIVGYVCDAVSVDPQSRCCPEKGEKFSCQWVFLSRPDKRLPWPWIQDKLEKNVCRGCNLLSQCCNSYEYCVSCCVNPARVFP